MKHEDIKRYDGKEVEVSLRDTTKVRGVLKIVSDSAVTVGDNLIADSWITHIKPIKKE